MIKSFSFTTLEFTHQLVFKRENVVNAKAVCVDEKFIIPSACKPFSLSYPCEVDREEKKLNCFSSCSHFSTLTPLSTTYKFYKCYEMGESGVAVNAKNELETRPNSHIA